MLIDLNKIKLSDIKLTKINEKDKLKYCLFKMVNSKLIFKIKPIKYIHCLYNKKNNNFVLKFSFENKLFAEFIDKLLNKSIEFIKKNKQLIFDFNVNNNDIKNFYFSNLEKDGDSFFMKVRFNKLNIFSEKNINFDQIIKYNFIIQISGIWFYKNYYGFDFNLNNIEYVNEI